MLKKPVLISYLEEGFFFLILKFGHCKGKKRYALVYFCFKEWQKKKSIPAQMHHLATQVIVIMRSQCSP